MNADADSLDIGLDIEEPAQKHARKLPEPGVQRNKGPSTTRASTPKGSRLFDESTLFLGNGLFTIIKRTDQDIPSYYVSCPLHGYHDGERRHPCVKAMSINQPDEPTVRLRLMKWVVQGLLT